MLFAHLPGLRGVRVMQQIIPFHKSSIEIFFSSNLVVLTTVNVARICLKEPSISPVSWHKRSVKVDGTVVSGMKYQGKLIQLMHLDKLLVLCLVR